MKKLTLVTLTLAAISSNSFAASMPFDVNAFRQMFSGGAGGQFYTGGVVGITDYNEGITDTAAVAGIRVGYEFNPYLAFELGYIGMGEVEVDEDVTLESNTKYIALKPILPIGSFIDAYGRIGAHSWDAEAKHRLGGSVSNSGTDFMYGAGLDLRLKSFSIGLGYSNYSMSEGLSLGNYELNVTYRM